MAKKTTWIKIDRNILQWGWYQDANTMRVFLHLLLTANVKPHAFMGVMIGRGEVATSYSKLAKTLGISIRAARTSISHLKTTGEVTIKPHPKFTVISIVNYNSYQANRQAERQANDKRATSERQQSKNIRIKEPPINGGTMAPPTVADVSAFCQTNGLQVDPQRFVDYYEATGWMLNGSPITSWQSLCRRWDGTEDYNKEQKSQKDVIAEAMKLLDERDRNEGLYDATGGS